MRKLMCKKWSLHSGPSFEGINCSLPVHNVHCFVDKDRRFGLVFHVAEHVAIRTQLLKDKLEPAPPSNCDLRCSLF
jgi:hypothetical protein